MPNDRRWTEGNDRTGLLKSPAKIDVIACFAVFRIKTAHAFKGPTIERHVTARNMLGDYIGKQHMARSARCRCNAGLNPIFGRRRNIWATDSGIVATQQSTDEVVQPICINHAVRVGVSENFTLRCGGAGIPSVAQALIVLRDVAHPWELRRDVRCIICRAIIDQNNLVLGIVKLT